MLSKRIFFWFRRLHPLWRVIIVLGVVELFLQFLAGNLREYAYFNLEGHLGNKPHLDEDPRLFWVPHDRFASVKQEMKKTKADQRIVFFGGSIVYGFPREENKSFPAFLQDNLDRNEKYGDWKVFNYAYPGYSSFQSSGLAQKIIKSYQSRLVVVSHAANDSRQMSFSDSQVAKINAGIGKKNAFFR